MIRNYDNADLGIVSLLLIGVGVVATGYQEPGLVMAIVAAIAGISRNGEKKKTDDSANGAK